MLAFRKILPLGRLRVNNVSLESRPEEEVDQKLALVRRFILGTGSTYDFMVNAATFGIDHRWKRIIIDALPANPARVLDLACGTGILTFAIARRYPRCRVVGVELRDEYLQFARSKARVLGLDNVEFVLCRAEDYASAEAFDCVVSSYLAKYADLPLLTRNTKTMLKEGGLVLMHDFTYPPKAYLVSLWRVYFKLLQIIGKPLFPAWREIFHGLPDLIERTRWCPELRRALEDNGFRDIRMRNLTLYGSALITALK
jgi:demethylmenaquinone methyltransferase/2-methoxy-6-polyprenyl-1,4-benzoquinol methylase